MIEIQKNVPVPQSKGTNSGAFPQKYPWDEMEVGDSFEVPMKGKHADNPRAMIKMFRNYASAAGRKRSTKDVAIRYSVGMDNDGNVRCWRVR